MSHDVSSSYLELPLVPHTPVHFEILAVLLLLSAYSQRIRLALLNLVMAYYAIPVGISLGFATFTIVSWTGFYLLRILFLWVVVFCFYVLYLCYTTMDCDVHIRPRARKLRLRRVGKVQHPVPFQDRTHPSGRAGVGTL